MSSRIIQSLAPRARAARVFVAIAVAGLSAAACDVHGISDPGSLSAIVVSPNPATLAVNGTQQFSAVGTDFSGANVPITPSWSVVAGGGTISASGLFTAATTPGTFASTVMATSGSVSSTATVIVTAGPLATIVVTPNPVSLGVGATQQFVAVGKDAAGNVIPFTPTWSVVAGGGSVNSTGLFTAGTVAGPFANTIQASSLGIKGTATVTVAAGPLATIVVTPNPIILGVGASQQFTAVGTDASGNVLPITPVWSVVAAGGVIGSTGLFTAGAVAGTFTNTVMATSGGIFGTATVTVAGGTPSLATIVVTPNPVILLANGTQQFSAVGRDGSGNNFPITPVWAVVSGGGTIDANTGVFTAGAVAGTFSSTVRATSGAVSGFATVTVTTVAPAPATITVTPNPASVIAGTTQQFVATGRDANGNIFAVTPVWSVVSGGGTIDPATGLFTAGAATGTFANTVKATSGAISGTATVTVTPIPPLATITVTPNPASVVANANQQFTAVGKDGNGNIIPITPVWSVVNGGGSIGASTGLFTAGAVAGTFTNTVKATSGAISGTATVTVTAIPPALATITVTPNPASVVANATQQFTAVGKDQNGNNFLITPVWSVVAGGGTIAPASGLFTAGAVAGTFTNTVKATSGAISGTATVTVTAAAPPPVDYLTPALKLNGIMAGTAFSCVALGTINANISISPGSTVSGFPPCVITGVQHLADATAATDQVALTAAYNTLAGLPCSATNTIGTTNIGGTTKAAGVYCSASSIGVTGVLTLDGGGDPNAIFVFQAGSALTTAGDVVLINSAQAKNVYWQVGSSATLGTASKFQGNILALTSISLIDTATLVRGRALARNGAVSMTTGNTITLPLP